MNESFPIEPFDDKFEDVYVYIHKLDLHFYSTPDMATDETNPAFTSVHTDMVPHFYTQGRELVGGLIITFRNQGEDKNLCLKFIGTLSAKSNTEDSVRSLFTKLIQYLFGWTDKYIKENRIVDDNGNAFVLPAFLYAKDKFIYYEDE